MLLLLVLWLPLFLPMIGLFVAEGRHTDRERAAVLDSDERPLPIVVDEFEFGDDIHRIVPLPDPVEDPKGVVR